MLSLIALFPPYLIAFTIVFLFIPTLISVLVRIKLHAYLRDSASKNFNYHFKAWELLF